MKFKRIEIMIAIIGLIIAIVGTIILPLSKKGTLRVIIEPRSALSAGAKWRIDQEWRESGEKLAFKSGKYTLEFKDINGWKKPDDRSIIIDQDKDLESKGEYLETGSLLVMIKPRFAIQTGAKWQIDGGEWYESGATISNIPVGSHIVDYKTIDGWTTPNKKKIEIQANRQTDTEGIYTKQIPSTGSLTVAINPDDAIRVGAKWRINKGEWYNSGKTVNISVGNYTIEYKKIGGWKEPDDEIILIIENTNQNIVTPKNCNPNEIMLDIYINLLYISVIFQLGRRHEKNETCKNRIHRKKLDW